MKKIVLVIALAAILATGTVFADHPGGLGIGLVGGFGWGGFNGEGAYGLSLKFPGIPIFWALNLGGGSDYFRIGLTGDNYIIDQAIAPDIGLNWFFGVGGFFNFYNRTDENTFGKWSRTNFNLGVRVPVGLSWQPVNLLEIFLDIAPSLGLYVDGAYKSKTALGEKEHKGDVGFFWGLPLEIGIRLWF
jgi:hypothetical protein